MKLKYKIIITSFIIFLSIINVNSKVFAINYVDDDAIAYGLFIDNINIGGMNKEEANVAIDEYVSNLRSKNISFIVDDKIIDIKFEDINYNVETNNFVELAMEVGKEGNLIKRYKDLKDVELENIFYQLSFKYDYEKLTNIIEEQTKEFNIAPVNASVARQNGNFVYTEHKNGRKVMVDETADILKDAISNWKQEDISVNVLVVDDMPEYTREFVEKCNQILGTYKTQYASSSSNRAGNLANGAKLVNNTVLYPGDIFSAYEYLTPFSPDNGYFTAGAYANGKVVDSIGGGACQVTTTLYNAVLYSELEVVERAPHSMTISYADLSRDSAIAGTFKDLKFKNNTDAPILIEAKTVGREITFIIWGNETRSKNRKVEYETVVLKTTNPPADKITKDNTLPETYRVVTQSAHIGYVAELYKLVYEDGNLISREKVNRSTYVAAPNHITIGTLPIEEVPVVKPEKPVKDPEDQVDGPKKPVKPPKEDPEDEDVDGFDEDEFDDDDPYEDE
ncbi:MAG TPA: hypothetical protein GXZ90_07280 [Clostridiales bacterium]|nr:hypothetical protein [Clostridiales bacterium]